MDYTDTKKLFFLLNLWLCPMSVLMVGITAVALGTPLHNIRLVVLLPFFLFYVIYVEDRRAPSSEDEINHPLRSALVQKYHSFLFWSEAIGFTVYQLLLLSLGFTGQFDPFTVVGAGQIPFLIVMSYGLLKRYPILDSIAVGFTWAYMAVFPILMVSNQATPFQSLPVFSGWFIITFAGSESRNVDDIEGDAHTGKPTLAGRLGQPIAPLTILSLKALGIVIFWAYTSPLVTILVLGYLVTLRLLREVTDTMRGTIVT